MIRRLYGVIVAGLFLLGGGAHGQNLAATRAAHHLNCGTVQAVGDWNGQDIHGNLSALGTEICRAVMVAIFGSQDGLALLAFPAEPEALTALQNGSVTLAVGISPSASTAMQYGVAFGPPIFYDSQRIMVAQSSGLTALADLRGKLICALDMTPPERTLRDEMTARGVKYALMAHSEQGEMDAALAVHRCVAGTGMESRLAQSRADFHARTSDFVFIAERLTVNPVVPAYRYGDQTFALIVEWTISALLEAEVLGITREGVGEASGREDMRTQQLLGHDFATAQALGLAHDWAAKVVAATGNYGEIFERTTGKPYHLERGLNALWTNGGLMTPVAMH
jgi:general L-amino acid transport system substrate-binding protein